MRYLLLAIQFLTIIPVRTKGNLSQKDIALSAIYFPVVGLFEGFLCACVMFLSLKVFSPDITGGIIILVLIAINGGFHIDGLADTFDAFSIKSTGDRLHDINKRLEVMKDSSTGAIGVITIVMSILLKYLFVASLLNKFSLNLAVFTILLMPFFSKWVMVSAIYYGRSARQDGLGKIFIGNMAKSSFILTTLYVTLIYFSIAIIISSGSLLFYSVFFPVIAAVLYIFSLLWVKKCNHSFDGLTGDNLGAANEIAEVIFLTIFYSYNSL